VSSLNLQSREVNVKVVYYGPGLGGKTSSLQSIHRALSPDTRGQLVSLATSSDRTLYFDFLPIKLPKLRGHTVRVHLYTVPGQVHYNSTRKLVLAGADGIVFVADSQRERHAANIESLANLEDNLREQGLKLRDLPFAIQYNKRDAQSAIPVEELEAALNPHRVPAFETVAARGKGVFNALKAITKLVLTDLAKKGALDLRGADGTGRRASTASELAATAQRTVSEPPAISDGVPTAPMGAGAGAAGSFEEIASAIEKLPPDARSMLSGPHKMPTAGPARTLSDLIPPSSARDAVIKVEGDIERGDWQGAVRRAAVGFRELSSRLAGSLAGSNAAEAATLAALLMAIPAARYVRFREAESRIESGGAVSSEDALFALFFLTDITLRADELRRSS
jgi:signal recognition particle receptor subunit beta